MGEAGSPAPALAGMMDEGGCLTNSGLAAVRAAPPGRAPGPLADHLAGCRRCQYRLLSGGRLPRKPGERRGAPLVWRVAALGLAGLLLTLLAVLATHWFSAA